MLIYSAFEMIRALPERNKFTIAFVPAFPRAGHPIRSVIRRAGGRIIADPHKADAVFFFPGKTSASCLGRPNPLAPGFNFSCEDTSDAHIARTFSGVFGYDIAVDPASFIGKIVVGSGRSDVPGERIRSGPIKLEDGQSYQKLIDNEMQPGFVVEFLCHTVKGEVPLVYVKVRRKEARFADSPTSIALVPAAEIFTPNELAKISQFCSEISLDWGVLSLLRDKTDGRIYIVGANTAMGPPPAALPLKDKLAAVDNLAAALQEAVLETPDLIARHVPADNDIEAVRPEIIVRVGS